MTRWNYLWTTALLSSICFAAQATETIYTFGSVTAIEYERSAVELTGVLVDESAPTTVTVPAPGSLQSDLCVNAYHLMLQHPGVYTLNVTTEVRIESVAGSPPTPVTYFIRCALIANP